MKTKAIKAFSTHVEVSSQEADEHYIKMPR